MSPGTGAVGLFFFSSRRRHTRLQGDWSSDVCSSDLCFMLVQWARMDSVMALLAAAIAPLLGVGSEHDQTARAIIIITIGLLTTLYCLQIGRASCRERV